MAKFSVKKANHLVKLEEKMSKASQLWVSYLVACLPKAKAGIDDFPTLQFTFKEIKNAINADGKKRIGKVQDVHAISKELMGTPLWYENENRRGYVAWLTDAFEDKNSEDQVFNFVFHPKLKPYLLNLETHYTIYNYFYRICLSTNSMKIYEILKSYQYMEQINLNIDRDIKEPLGLKGKYEKFYDFKKKVLEVAQRELAKFTDITFEYEVSEKEWNKAVGLFFLIRKNTPTHLPEPLLEFVKTNKSLPAVPIEATTSSTSSSFKRSYPDVYKRLSGWGGKESVITQIITEYGIDAVKYQIEHLKRRIKEKAKINDKFGWFRKAVQDEYSDPVQEKKKKKANALLARKQAEEDKKRYAAAVTQLKNYIYEQEKQETDKLLNEYPDLLSEAVENLRGSSMAVRKEILKGKAPEEIYENVFAKGAIKSYVQEKYPQRFQAISQEYKEKMVALKTDFFK